MDKKRWYVVTGLLVFLVIAVRWWHSTIYTYLDNQISTKTAVITGLEQKKALIPDARYQVATLQHTTETIKKDLETVLVKHAFANPEEFLEHLVRRAEESGLRLSFITPQQSKHKNFYEKNVYSISMLGSYEQCTHFFDQFCIKYPNAVVKNATIKRFEDTLIIDALMALYTTNRDGL